MTESEVTNAIIDSLKTDEKGTKFEFEPESHYNFYGDRGVVDLRIDQYSLMDGDLITSWNLKHTHLIEVKSVSAIENATGPNEILQQFNKMREYYIRDETKSVAKNIAYELCFELSTESLKHVYRNQSIYSSSITADVGKVNQFNEECFLSLRCPETGEQTRLILEQINLLDDQDRIDQLRIHSDSIGPILDEVTLD